MWICSPTVIPAKAGIQSPSGGGDWAPAFAGVTIAAGAPSHRRLLARSIYCRKPPRGSAVRPSQPTIPEQPVPAKNTESLFQDDFPAAGYGTWRPLVEQELRGASFEKTLCHPAGRRLRDPAALLRRNSAHRRRPGGFPGVFPFTRGQDLPRRGASWFSAAKSPIPTRRRRARPCSTTSSWAPSCSGCASARRSWPGLARCGRGRRAARRGRAAIPAGGARRRARRRGGRRPLPRLGAARRLGVRRAARLPRLRSARHPGRRRPAAGRARRRLARARRAGRAVYLAEAPELRAALVSTVPWHRAGATPAWELGLGLAAGVRRPCGRSRRTASSRPRRPSRSPSPTSWAAKFSSRSPSCAPCGCCGPKWWRRAAPARWRPPASSTWR